MTPTARAATPSSAATEHRVDAGGLRWRVQVRGDGPALLLLHGTGAASDSWRDLLPALAADFTVIAPDLPGHGGTTAPARGHAGLDGMAEAVSSLLRALDEAPGFVAGHSAGAAIAARMALARGASPGRQAWIGAALQPFGGVAGAIASPLAQVLAGSAVLARIAAWGARNEAAVRRVIAGTGSRLDAAGIATYGTLLRQPAHIAGALSMMAGWDLRPLWQRLPEIGAPVLLIHGDRDRAVPARQSDEVAARLRGARVVRLHAGHLVHEEQPAVVAGMLRGWFLDDGGDADA